MVAAHRNSLAAVVRYRSQVLFDICLLQFRFCAGAKALLSESFKMYAVGKGLQLDNYPSPQVGGAASCRRRTGDLIAIAAVERLLMKLLTYAQIERSMALFGRLSIVRCDSCYSVSSRILYNYNLRGLRVSYLCDESSLRHCSRAMLILLFLPSR